jgi:hypothetical protein
MNIDQQIRIDLPSFRGLYVNDAVPLATVSSLGVTMAWVLGQKNIAYIQNGTIREILIAGNDKLEHPCYAPPHGSGTHPRQFEKGLYFIATIERIEHCISYLSTTHGHADPAFQQHHSHIAYPCSTAHASAHFNDRRYAIYFNNPTSVRRFSSCSFDFVQNPVGRI